MNTIGIILLGLLGLLLITLLLVLVTPIRIYAGYKNKSAKVQIRLLFFHFTLVPAKKKQKKKKPEKAKKKEKQPTLKEETKGKKKKKKGPSLHILFALIKKHLPKLLKQIHIRRLNVNWYIHAQDAKDTAIQYGAWSAVFAGALAIFERFARGLSYASVDLYPDYDGDRGGFEGDITLSFRLLPLLICLLRAILDAVKLKLI